MIISVLLIAVMLCGGAMAAYKADVLTSSLKVFNVKKEYIGSLAQGTDIYVIDISRNGNWAKIVCNGKVGFASMQGIIFENEIKAVCVKDASMRFVTKSSYLEKKSFVTNVEVGTLVNVVGYYDGYLLIESTSGNGLGVVKAANFRKLK